MTKQALLTIIILLQCTYISCQTSQNNFPVQKGLYLGQKPPGKIPELFASDIISNDVHDSPNISLDEKEIVLGTMGEGLKYYKIIDGNLSLIHI